METEILSTLNEIKAAIYILLTVVILGVIANWVRAGISIKNVVRNELDDIFTEEASNYYDKGNFEELLEHCEEKLIGKWCCDDDLVGELSQKDLVLDF